MSTATPICIVDDAPDYRLLLHHLFKYRLSAYPVAFFADGSLFLEELDSMTQRPPLIILDRHMPGLDGYRVLLLLKQHPMYRTIPVVMMSADASVAEITAYYKAGVNSFIIKPLDFDSLTELMQALCVYWLSASYKLHDT